MTTLISDTSFLTTVPLNQMSNNVFNNISKRIYIDPQITFFKNVDKYCYGMNTRDVPFIFESVDNIITIDLKALCKMCKCNSIYGCTFENATIGSTFLDAEFWYEDVLSDKINNKLYNVLYSINTHTNVNGQLVLPFWFQQSCTPFMSLPNFKTSKLVIKFNKPTVLHAVFKMCENLSLTDDNTKYEFKLKKYGLNYFSVYLTPNMLTNINTVCCNSVGNFTEILILIESSNTCAKFEMNGILKLNNNCIAIISPLTNRIIKHSMYGMSNDNSNIYCLCFCDRPNNFKNHGYITTDATHDVTIDFTLKQIDQHDMSYVNVNIWLIQQDTLTIK
jgi:hypothetical protein